MALIISLRDPCQCVACTSLLKMYSPSLLLVVCTEHNPVNSSSGLQSQDTVQEIMLEFTEGRLMISKVASLLLCLHGTKEVPLGMLRAKANTLIQNLKEPLTELATS
ncbi:hypothetical protein EG68_03606 [Paragonimus skrjabini miyazakii]|uniref:Uncharacterized protein n=1 Tax=Paragonimus skrjabini miyazakii TaxID=59628 RepID=A0A8S9Z016_9TREM|nr:hypothetical protein EG68_03606 [Paragonimus skrjabini miyazakii]